MDVELTVVMPCLNEEDTIGMCVKEALDSFSRLNILGEVIVVDNGSTDDSAKVARTNGAKVFCEEKKGYGNAIRRGIKEAKGRYVIMGDADGTYDFSRIEPFVSLLRQGADLVMGSRVKGKIFHNAMPWSHRYIGNPVLTGILNRFFDARISDAHCGLRGFKKESIEKLGLKTMGMEFASEILVMAVRAGLSIKEIPIEYHPSVHGRKSHLHPFRDGWRHLRFMLILCPKYLFLFSGFLIFLCGFFILFLSMFKILVIFSIPLGITSMVAASALMFLGMQIILLGVFAKLAPAYRHFTKEDALVKFIRKYFTLEKGLILGGMILIFGLLVAARTFYLLAKLSAYGPIDVKLTRISIGAIAIVICGIQLIFSSFYLCLFDDEGTNGGRDENV